MQFIKSMLNYFFESQPGINFKFYMPLIILAVLLIAGGIIFSFIYNKKKKEDLAFKFLFRKFGSNMALMGILFIFLVAVRYENIPYFAMRIWIYLSLLGLLYLIYRYVKKFKVDYPKEKQNHEHHKHVKEENKYLPNK